MTTYRLEADELQTWHDELVLDSGGHDSPNDGMCVNEAIAWITGSDFNAQPDCVHPVIRAFAISWNDSLNEEDRNRLLKPLMWDMVDTASPVPAAGERLAWMATDWLVRVQTPAWLRLAGLNTQADSLASLAELNPDTTPGIMPTLKAVRTDSAAAWAAAGDAAGAAAWDAAGAAAGDAAGAAAWAAAGGAARAAAGYAARAAAGYAARDAARDAARAAARAALRFTTTELQTSAADLLQRMCAEAKAA